MESVSDDSDIGEKVEATIEDVAPKPVEKPKRKHNYLSAREKFRLIPFGTTTSGNLYVKRPFSSFRPLEPSLDVWPEGTETFRCGRASAFDPV